jgi:hypothetical protein
MQLTYYNNKTDKRYVDKNLALLSLEGHSNPVNIKILDNMNLAHPTFKMSDKDLYMTANYCYVDDLHRYYFIDNITLSNGYAFLECTVDVLMSYKTALRKQNCIIKRQEHNYDMYQNDGEIPVKQYPAKRCIGHFESPFNMERVNFVMGVVGAIDTEESEGE